MKMALYMNTNCCSVVGNKEKIEEMSIDWDDFDVDYQSDDESNNNMTEKQKNSLLITRSSNLYHQESKLIENLFKKVENDIQI